MKTGGWQMIAAAITVGFEISLIIGGSLFCGLWLDQQAQTLPLFIIIFLLLGIAGSFWRIMKLGNK